MNEVWKDVIDFEGLYQVSNLGNFRKHPNKQGKSKNPKSLSRCVWVNCLGYKCVSISKNGKKCNKTIHQLVSAAFIPNFKYGMIVNHIDGNKKNNKINNLEISNYVHNNTHAHSIGLMPKPGKSKYHNVSMRKDKRLKHPTWSYVASIKINSKRHYIGVFKNEIEAAKAVDNFLDSINDTIRQRNFS